MKNIILLLFLFSFVFSQQSISNDTLHWNKNRQLSFADFKAKSVDGIGLGGEAFCYIIANYDRPHAFAKFRFIVNAIFDRNKSWISSELKSDQGLMYFQVMFNIYELHARKLKQELIALENFIGDPKAEFQEKYNKTMSNLFEEFNQYRKETKLGGDVHKTLGWKLKIEKKMSNI